MKNLPVYISVAAVLATISCARENVPDISPLPDGLVPVTIDASVPETRVSLSDNLPVWEKGDRIGVFTSDMVLCPAFTAGNGGSSTTSFSGQKPEWSTLAYAFYPYDADASFSKDAIALSLPESQSGKAGEAVMVATGNEEDGFEFQNVCSLVRMTIPQSLNVRKVELYREDRVSGSFTVEPASLQVTASEPATHMDRRAEFSGASALSGEYTLAVLPSSSKTLEMAFTDGQGKVALVNTAFKTGKPYEAGRIKNLGSVGGILSFNDAALVADPTGSHPIVASGSVQPQDKPQITNGDFETWTFDGENLPNCFNSFQTADGSYSGSAYSGSNRQVKRSTDTRPGSLGKYSCDIWSRKVGFWFITVIAQGNLTTGRVHAGSTSATGEDNYNYSDRDGSTTNNGVKNPCAMPFTGRPDSLVVWVKFAPAGNDSDHPYAKVTATIHDDFDYIDGYSKTSDKSHVVATAVNMNIAKTNGWKRLAIPFQYTGNSAQPKYILLSAATNAYPGGGNENDHLYLDDIELVYNSSYTLSLGSQGWASMYLDYNALVPAGATAYYVTGLVAGYAKMVEIPAGKVIPAQTAVLVKSAQSQVTFESSGSDPVSVSGNILEGSAGAKSCGNNKYLVLSSESTPERAVFGEYSGSTLAANHAYIEIP